MNLFIDTNVFLSFYHLTNDDLEELRKLSVLLDQEKVCLFLPEQVIDEYRRNRESKIAVAVKALNKQKLNLQFPALCKDYPEYIKLRHLQKQYEKQHASLLAQVNKSIETNSLKADQVIKELFDKAQGIKSTNELVELAFRRVQLGNPPGKRGSVGDAMNWEALLANVPANEDLYIIADDRDFFSALNEERPSEFLVKEWKKKKASEVHFFRRLSTFFKQHYPDIELARELETELAVRRLVASGSFNTTHNAISMLDKFEWFSESQVNEMATAALSNTQINWILGDSDVFAFFSNLVDEYKDKINPDTAEALVAELARNQAAQVDDDEIPF